MQINRKGQMELSVKILFIVFVVILMFVVFFIVLKSNVEQSNKSVGDQYTDANQFVMGILSDPSLVEGDYSNTPIQGLFVAEKLSNQAPNKELDNINNIGFLYSVRIFDEVNGKSWTLGLSTAPFFSEKTISFSYPVAIEYKNENSKVDYGKAVVNLYFGEIPTLISEIKGECAVKRKRYLSVNTKYPVVYNQSSGMVNVSGQVFYPFIPCSVKSFAIPKGKHLLLISFENNQVIVKR